ncbi:pyridoxal-phosphate-dependent aminotransferase family protein [Bacteroides congonensis]|uniref:pyridoxal-phosphate-dependent aminotransferase family protein n=1 Tax=Bacteroides congonensis TaxID=1871006 RepID=UPI0009337CAB|nr:aminotransferase class V-fold PLP-dependent enzyme [Bacteroides congonensis]
MKSYVFPGNIEDSILQIGGKPFPYMRTEQFSELVKDSEKMLLDLMHCPGGRVIFYTASGTGAMDAVVANYVSQFKKAFIIAGGSFGYRWKNLCEYYHCPNEVFAVPFAQDIDYVQLEEAVAASRPDVFLCQHHETSTGQLYNIERISEICKRYSVSLVVDAISSFLSDELDMEAFGIDVCITSSQKGLNIAPGLSFLFLSPKILATTFAHKSYYFDFAENLKNLERGQTPYSPATTIFLQLHARLKMDISLGVRQIIASVRARALYFRELCKQNCWEMPVEVPSNCITGFFVRRNGDILFRELLKQDIYIMPGGTPGYFRVSHLGVQTTEDLDDLANRIKDIENR